MFTIELEELKTKAIDKLRELIAEHGVESKHTNKICFTIPLNELPINLFNSGWVYEITQHELISNSGYQFSFNSIPLEELLQIVDYFVEKFGIVK